MKGESLGHFEILEPLGAGGMGEVYLAQDTQLNRKVALKMLPPAFADDPERLGRFRREAETLAALNDSRIGQIYGLETGGTRPALVLELIPGPTLAERIAEGPIPEAEVIAYAIEIAGALETAHRAGIVHRDLKPANIKLPPGGGVKVLDFGLAKAIEGERGRPDVADSPTLTMQATRAGVILGTAAYMAPEQAKGAPVDRRADVWAFGAVLFEMLTGRKAFKGSDTSEILASVLAREPEWEALPGAEGSRLHALLTRCMQKDPERRYRDIGDVALQLEEIRDTPEPEPAAVAGGALRAAALASMATLLLCTAAFALWSATRPSPPAPDVVRFEVPYPEGTGFENFAAMRNLALSPHGDQLALIADAGIWIRRLHSLEARPLTVEGFAASPVFSPDGEWIAHLSGGRLGGTLRKVRASGGAGVALAEWDNQTMAGIDQVASWTHRDTLLVGGSSILEIPAGGGSATTLVDFSGGTTGLDAQLLPDGQSLLYVAGEFRQDGFWIGRLTVHDLETNEATVLLEDVQNAQYLASGHLLFVQNGTLTVRRFDLDSLEFTSGQTPIVDSIATSSTGRADFAARYGALAYVDPPESPGRRLVWVDRQGNATPMALEPADYSQPRLSPDGRRIALQIDDDLWVHDLDRGTTTKVTQNGGSRPVWMADGRTLIFVTNEGLARVRADGSAPPELWLEGPFHSNSITPDGRTFLYHTHERGSADIMLMDMDAGEPETWLATSFSDDGPSVSPDGSSIAFVSNSSGRNEVFVASLSGERSRTQISIDGGDQPRWVGDRIYFRDDEHTYQVAVQTQPELSVGRPERLFTFEDPPPPVGPFANYDVTADGERFLMVEGEEDSGRIVVTLNWLEEIERLLR